MRAAHTHGATTATAEAYTAATHTHGTSATAAEVSATAAATEVSAATASAANMSATTATAETAASGVSSRRQTNGYGYGGRACRDFPHDTPHRGQMRKPTPDRPVGSGACCNAHVVRFTS